MTALQLAADILAGVFLCLLFAAVYVAVKVEQEEKLAGEQKRREVFMEPFQMYQKVTINLNGASGIVKGIADFDDSGRKYLVEYSGGGLVESKWFGPDEITAKEEVPA